MRKLAKRLFLTILLLLLLFGGWAAYYAQDKGFSRHWRNFVHSEFRKRGVHAKIRRLNLDPIRGLIAKDVLVYEDQTHDVLLMEIDKIAIDVDFSELLSRQVSIRSVEVREARVTIPLDPRDKGGDRLQIDRLSGRILTPPETLRIVRTDAMINGIQLSINGLLSRAPELPQPGPQSPDDATPATSAGAIPLEELRNRRQQIAAVLDFLRQFTLTEEDPPTLALQVEGSLASLSDLKVKGTLTSGPIAYRGYQATSLQGTFEREKDLLRVSELILADDYGKLETEFVYRGKEEGVPFTLQSSSDVHGLVSSMIDNPLLQEVVFFEPPRIEASGVFQPGMPFSWENLPIEVLGTVKGNGFTSRGVVFEALSFDFHANGDHYFLRNGQLEHKDGVLAAAVIRKGEELRFETDLRIPPTVFSPFIASDSAKQFLKRWRFQDDSAVFARLEGVGPWNEPGKWLTTGVVDFRNCRLNNHPISELQCDLQLLGTDHEFFNITLKRPEGSIQAEHVHLDHAQQLCHLLSVSG
ncbi:MAG: hypothetical protein AAF191_17700, partial [Verrucomicrobiota bacterium]